MTDSSRNDSTSGATPAAGAQLRPFASCELPRAAMPRRVLVAPYGEVESTHGSFVVDEEGLAAVIAAFDAHRADLPIDFEHQSLGGVYSAPNGLAPAAGWIKSLRAIAPSTAADASAGVGELPASTEAGPAAEGSAGSDAARADDSDGAADEGAADALAFAAPGLWAEVEWTPLAVEHLSTRQYRYLSPVALVRRADRRMVGLHSVALTNKPAIVGMRPVVARQERGTDDALDGVRQLREALGLAPQADDAHVLIAAAERIRSLQDVMSVQSAHARVERAARSGRLAAAQRDWAFALALRDPNGFEEWLASAPQVVPLGRTTAPAEAPTGSRVDGAARAARDEYRRHRDALGRLCSEEAFVADALRTAGLSPDRA